jgi:hypothetical protein
MTRRNRLLLHIGHGKTGSSFLQNCFAASLEELDGAGISYPIDYLTLKQARKGLTTEGNYPPLSLEAGHSIEALKALVETLPEPCRKRILISNEGMFQSIILHEFLSGVRTNFPDYDLDILLFIRDPFEHLISAYQELLKGDHVSDPDSLFQTTSVPKAVALCMDKAEEASASIHIFNYSRHRRNITNVAEIWLGLPKGTLRMGPQQNVNRSMDRSEIAIQQMFNKYIGSWARQLVADPLCAELPNIVPRKPFVNHLTLLNFLDRMRHDVSIVNARIPHREWYAVPTFEEAIAAIPVEREAAKIELSVEQLEVLVKNISNHLPKEWKKT